MIAFVFEYAEDLTTFNNIVKREGWQKINSLSAPSANLLINDTPNYNINSLKYAMVIFKISIIFINICISFINTVSCRLTQV
jgi:hypothetical protein